MWLSPKHPNSLILEEYDYKKQGLMKEDWNSLIGLPQSVAFVHKTIGTKYQESISNPKEL
jgi:hypothetical protein